MVAKAVALARQGTSHVMQHAWTLADWRPFIITAWMVVNLPVGSRKGESTELPGDVDENDWFTRASVTAIADGRTYVDPPPAVCGARCARATASC